MSYRVNISDFLEMINYPPLLNTENWNKPLNENNFQQGNISINEERIKENLSIVKTNYHTQNDLILDCVENESFLELHFNLSKSDIIYKNSFTTSEKVPPMAGNMIFVSNNKEKSEIIFNKEIAYQTFDIHLSLQTLNEYWGENHSLDAFLLQASKNKSVGLTDNAIRLNSKIWSNIQDIENCMYQGLMRKIYLESKVFEILAYCFEEQHKDAQIKLSTKDADRIHYAGYLIKSHIDNPITIKELAKEIGINETKLKLGFKNIFGTTVFGYLQDLRMKRAKMLLLDTDLSIDEISQKCGYINVSNFSNAFKNHFGSAPSSLRQFTFSRKN